MLRNVRNLAIVAALAVLSYHGSSALIRARQQPPRGNTVRLKATARYRVRFPDGPDVRAVGGVAVLRATTADLKNTRRDATFIWFALVHPKGDPATRVWGGDSDRLLPVPRGRSATEDFLEPVPLDPGEYVGVVGLKRATLVGWQADGSPLIDWPVVASDSVQIHVPAPAPQE